MRIVSIICFIAWCILPNALYADVLESIFMPGPLVQAHAKFESQCNKCHKKLNKGAQNNLCRDCHKKVSRDMKFKIGFHGRAAGLHKQACKTCHTDHIGRKANIVKLNRDTFNHNWSDFKLTGKHRRIGCNQCHKKNKKWREASTKCISCHRKSDVHRGKLGKKCSKCHNAQAWVTKKFDHNKTRFALKGKHRKVDCESCHPNKKYKNTPVKCYACHRIDDKHRGFYNNACKKCHSSRDWKFIVFNHNRQTKYKLTGMHKTISCTLCHKRNPFKIKLKQSCLSCHRLDDRHKGSFGSQCAKCHSTLRWVKRKFDHNKTKFPLKGMHTKAGCNDCHIGKIIKQQRIRICFSCHKNDDAHKNKEGKKCGRCHNASGWRKKVIFDHDTTKFPLLGMHSLVACEECHTKRDLHEVKTSCQACHAKKDVHKGSLTNMCNRCHNPNAWNTWIFNHNKQTKYKIKGAHKKLNCSACHNTPVKNKIRMSTQCGSCHVSDDIHGGNYGQQCDRCHNLEKFRDVVINRQ